MLIFLKKRLPLNKVESANEPIDLSGRRLSPLSLRLYDKECLNQVIVYRWFRIPPIYTPGWREALWGFSVLPKFLGQGWLRRRAYQTRDRPRPHFPENTLSPLSQLCTDSFGSFFQFAGIVFSCYTGIGFGLGSMIGGFLLDIIGGSRTFLLSGGVTSIVLVLCVFYSTITKLLDRKKNNKMENNADDYESG